MVIGYPIFFISIREFKFEDDFNIYFSFSFLFSHFIFNNFDKSNIGERISIKHLDLGIATEQEYKDLLFDINVPFKPLSQLLQKYFSLFLL